ncbi:MAG: 2-C-methyl-D-erythritol 4-phosphate cytidylyltransferase [bacterium]
MEKIVSIIAAAGKSARMGGADKLFAPILGRPLIYHTLAPFFEAGCFAAVALVLDNPRAPENRRRTKDLLDSLPVEPRIVTCEGGATRCASVMNGLRALEEFDPKIVVVHDGARPVITAQDLIAVAGCAREHGAASFALPAADTLVGVAPGEPRKYLQRDNVFHLQTPQAFRFDLLTRACGKIDVTDPMMTDDTAVVAALGVEAKLITGRASNLKVTVPDDLRAVEALLAAPGWTRGGGGRR